MKTVSQPQPAGIEPDQVYRLDQFMALSGLGIAAMRTARRGGLPVLYVGNRGFVRGSDFHAWLGSRENKPHHLADPSQN
jgi:hypothetical protein